MIDSMAPGAPLPVRQDQDKALPLPGWLKKVYYIFPVILYIPDAIFNFYVYSDGVKRTGNTVLDVSQMVLWACVSLGVVGMAYLLSVIAPWHWRNSHRLQALFCGLGVLVATGITTWNSFSYRSDGFTAFRTDQLANSLWPQLQQSGLSLTMILVSVAPPFWGLFWAIVQPIDTHRGMEHLRLSHEERVLRAQQDAELKAIRADANARVRAAQIKGMAQTAAAARDQAKTIFKKNGEENGSGSTPAAAAAVTVEPEPEYAPAPLRAIPAPVAAFALDAPPQPPAASAASRSRTPRSRRAPSATSATGRATPVAAGDPPAYSEPQIASPLSAMRSQVPAHVSEPGSDLPRYSF